MSEHNGKPMDVRVHAAVRADALLIQNLVQLYTHDFSEFWAGTARGEVNVEGRFDPYPLDPYWSRENWSASIIWCDRMIAGFALVNDETHCGVAAHRNMGEFFILRKYRGQGVGCAAAQRLFSLHPGTWEVAVTRANIRAWSFWRKTVSASAKASSISQMDMQTSTWNGPILRFEWGCG